MCRAIDRQSTDVRPESTDGRLQDESQRAAGTGTRMRHVMGSAMADLSPFYHQDAAIYHLETDRLAGQRRADHGAHLAMSILERR